MEILTKNRWETLVKLLKKNRMVYLPHFFVIFFQNKQKIAMDEKDKDSVDHKYYEITMEK